MTSSFENIAQTKSIIDFLTPTKGLKKATVISAFTAVTDYYYILSDSNNRVVLCLFCSVAR